MTRNVKIFAFYNMLYFKSTEVEEENKLRNWNHINSQVTEPWLYF